MGNVKISKGDTVRIKPGTINLPPFLGEDTTYIVTLTTELYCDIADRIYLLPADIVKYSYTFRRDELILVNVLKENDSTKFFD